MPNRPPGRALGQAHAVLSPIEPVRVRGEKVRQMDPMREWNYKPEAKARLDALLQIFAARFALGDEFTRVVGAVTRGLAAGAGGGCTILIRRQANRFAPVAVDHARAESRAWLHWLDLVSQPPLTSAFTRKLLETGEPIAMPVVSSPTLRLWTHPSFDGHLELFAVKSLLVVPIKESDRVVGSIAVWREEPCNALDERDLSAIEAVAQRISDDVWPW